MVNAVEHRRMAYASEPASQEHRAPAAVVQEAPEAPHTYSTFDGFKSFATGEALSIDDIVKGLARSTAQAMHYGEERTSVPHTEPIYDNVEPVYENVEPIAENVEPIYDNVEPIEEAPQRAARPAQAASPVPTEVPVFIKSLLAGNREEVFAMTREVVLCGGNPEAFLTQATCALDDAYRARLEGTPVNKEIEKLTAGVATPVLERVVTALSTAVDSSYSVGITGAKMAITRALAVLGA
jgi:hypothetical protein